MISSLTEVIMNAPKAVLWRDLQNWPFSIHQYNYCSQTKQQWSVPKTLYLTVANGNISVLKWRCWSVITFPVILNKKNSSRCFQSIIKIHIYNLVPNKVMLHQFVSHLSNGSDTCMCWINILASLYFFQSILERRTLHLYHSIHYTLSNDLSFHSHSIT